MVWNPTKKTFAGLLTVVAVGIIVGGAILWRTRKITAPPSLENQRPYAHFYRDSKRNIANIRLYVFYAVPVNRKNEASGDWQETISAVLRDVERFHELQFRGLSKIKSFIYPEIFFLEKESLAYDTEFTDGGNPEALKRVVYEIEKRAGDFLKKEDGGFPVITVVYEGVGASGADGATLLSFAFLAKEEYKPFRVSLFYHEFGHAIGMPDQYDPKTDEPFSLDIMGSGRRQPIEKTYIDKELLKEMGVIFKKAVNDQ